jgi:hypothetical protein
VTVLSTDRLLRNSRSVAQDSNVPGIIADESEGKAFMASIDVDREADILADVDISNT